MNTAFRLFPERASSIAREVDHVFFFLLAVSAFFITLIAGAILFFAVHYRRSRNVERTQLHGGLIKLEILWSVVPFSLTMVMFGWGATVFYRIKSPPPDAMEIYVVGKQWMWEVNHPSGRRERNQLHVPVGRPVVLRLISEDVIHSFYVPAFRVKQDVLPGRYTSLWFEPTKPGEYHLFCAEYCGTEHSHMRGQVVVMDASDYQQWLEGSGETRPLAERGEWTFQRLSCDRCHAQSDDLQRGPTLLGKFGKPVQLANGQTVTFDEAYVRESILRPREHVVAGYPPIMPTYKGQITESEILGIIDYLKGTNPELLQDSTNTSRDVRL